MAAIRIQTGQRSPPQTPEPMDVVLAANMVINSVGDGHWRPRSSISQNALTTETSEPENPDDEAKEVISLRNKSRVSIGADFASTTGGAESPLQVQSFAGHLGLPRDPPPTRAVSIASKTNGVKRRLRLRTAPGKLERTKELDRAFATMDDRTRVTFDGIRGNTRTSLNEFGDRVCRPYSVYTVTKQCERLAISPFGGPLVNSAAGRYRERYLNKHRPDVVKCTSRESVQVKFHRFYDNLDLLAINVKRIPFGTLRKPPPKQARNMERQTKSVPTQLHKYTNERVANLHESMDRQQEGQPGKSGDGKRLGVMSVEYKVAMEVSSNLEKHRRSRPSNLPVLPHFLPGRTDALRLQTQTERLLTPGELSLKEGISTNLYDHERSKRGPIKAIEKPPRRIKSPPLSKLSREKFLPDAQRRRDQDTWSGLRIGRPVTPPASEYTALQSSSFATTVKPVTGMTTNNGGSENNRQTKSAKPAKPASPVNQENETEQTEESVLQKEELENATASHIENEPDDTKPADEIGENDDGKPSEELHETLDCSMNENGPVIPNSGPKNDDKPDSSNTSLSSTSLVITVPDGEGVPVVHTAADEEGSVEVTSGGEQGTDVNDGAVVDEGNAMPEEPGQSQENDSNENDEPDEH